MKKDSMVAAELKKPRHRKRARFAAFDHFLLTRGGLLMEAATVREFYLAVRPQRGMKMWGPARPRGPGPAPHLQGRGWLLS